MLPWWLGWVLIHDEKNVDIYWKKYEKNLQGKDQKKLEKCSSVFKVPKIKVAYNSEIRKLKTYKSYKHNFWCV